MSKPEFLTVGGAPEGYDAALLIQEVERLGAPVIHVARDDKRLAVSDTPNLDAALLLTGFPYDRRERAARYLKFVLAMLERAQGLRRAGSACQDLCWIASGVGDGYWEFGLQTWDVAAGILLVEEAGGCVTDIAGGPVDLQRPRLLATNGRLHAEMHAVLAPLLSSADGLAGDSGA